MKPIRCLLGFHEYEYVEDHDPEFLLVRRCNRCGAVWKKHEDSKENIPVIQEKP